MAANRGEWAELYVIFKLLGEGKIYAADENLNKNINSYLEILKIIREEVREHIIEYKTGLLVEIYVENKLTVSIPASEFVANAGKLLKTITTSVGRSFGIEESIYSFMHLALIKQFKSPSRGYYENFGGKNDIIMEIRDHSTALITKAGFSIKSKYKNPATLFNAAKASAFVYELTNIIDTQMDEINSLVTSKGGRDKNARIDFIMDNNICLVFSQVKILSKNTHSTFEDNIDLIRGDMKEILNEVLLVHYLNRVKNSKLSDICNKLVISNPLDKRNPENFYKKAIKDFLYSSFAGMTASETWDGTAVVNGGYIVAKDDGDVLVYHTRDGESFRTFLFNNTKIDRPSASEGKWDYAYVYKLESKYFIDLNFQIRFID